MPTFHERTTVECVMTYIGEAGDEGLAQAGHGIGTQQLGHIQHHHLPTSGQHSLHNKPALRQQAQSERGKSPKNVSCQRLSNHL